MMRMATSIMIYVISDRSVEELEYVARVKVGDGNIGTRDVVKDVE